MKRVVVTGGAKGIGRALVEELAGAGYEVTATYHGSKDAADEIATKYPNVKFLQYDLEDREQLKKCIAELLSGKPIDVFVSNAGPYLGKEFAKMTEAELYQQMTLHFTTPTHLIHGLLPSFQKAKAPIVLVVSSQAAQGRLTGEAVYSAAKAAMSTLTYVLRAELNQHNIRITTLEPYGINTYSIPEPSNLVLPAEFAQVVRYAAEMPDHLQLDWLSVSHIKQTRPDYPDWIAR